MLTNIGTTDTGIVSAINFLIGKGALIFLVICFPQKKKKGDTLLTPGTKSYRINEVGPQCFYFLVFSGQISPFFNKEIGFFFGASVNSTNFSNFSV
jgi:hypothetical protein